MSRYDSSDDNLMRQLWDLCLMILFLLLGGTFMVALWLTRTLYQVINFLTAGLLDRLDELIVVLAGLLWGAITLFASPLVLDQGLPYEESLLSLAIVGNLFGWCVGYHLLLEQWDKARYPTAITPSFIEALHLPADHYQQQPLPAFTPAEGMSVKELEALFRNSNSPHAVAVQNSSNAHD